MSVGRLIETDTDVAEGATWLAERCPRMGYALSVTGPLPLRCKPDGFAQLLSAIVSQQVSVASASAIWTRMETAGLDTPKGIVLAGEQGLRQAGLSRQKIRYAQALAEAEIDYGALRRQTDQDVVKTLVAVPGIGEWTAEIYAMFSLGRADVFAAGDLALQEAARDLYALETRPSPKELRQMATAWSPWRSVAARLLFAYYRTIKKREGIA